MTGNQPFYVQHFSDTFQHRKGRKVIKASNENLHHLDKQCLPIWTSKAVGKIKTTACKILKQIAKKINSEPLGLAKCSGISRHWQTHTHKHMYTYTHIYTQWKQGFKTQML